jgi:hypothetical protein
MRDSRQRGSPAGIGPSPLSACFAFPLASVASGICQVISHAVTPRSSYKMMTRGSTTVLDAARPSTTGAGQVPLPHRADQPIILVPGYVVVIRPALIPLETLAAR